jgi:hypothetical protein
LKFSELFACYLQDFYQRKVQRLMDGASDGLF